MELMCLFGSHEWTGCKCSSCGKTRDIEHDWTKDCQQCERCGRTRENAHQWNGCVCSVCCRTRDEGHDWTKDCERCSGCGKTRQNLQKWHGCRCSACGKTRHEWGSEQRKFLRCGATKIEIATLEDLDAVRHCHNAHYVQVADIDASETKNWDHGQGFAPIVAAGP